MLFPHTIPAEAGISGGACEDVFSSRLRPQLSLG